MTENHVATASKQIRATPAEVWDVLTDAARVPEFMFGSELVTDWTVGSSIVYRGEWNGRPFEDKGEVLVFEPPHRLATSHYSPLSGEPDVPESYHTVTYALEPIGDDRTRIVLTQDRNASEEEASHAAENWETMLESLREAVEKDILSAS